MNSQNKIDQELMDKLSLLETVPTRSKDKQDAGLAAFLLEAQQYTSSVTPAEKPRHIRWMYTLQSIFKVQLKEHSTMFSTIATVLIITSLILGGGSATVAAAQTSLPDQPLYSLKVLSEDVRLGLSRDPQSEFQLALEFADRRAAEIQVELRLGTIPPESVQLRYQEQIEQAVRFAIGLPTEKVTQALEQIHARLQVQNKAFIDLKVNEASYKVLFQLQSMLHERIQWVELGLTDPAQLRDRLQLLDQQRDQDRDQLRLITGTPQAQRTKVPTATGGVDSKATGVAMPKVDPGDCNTCTGTPVGESNNPWTTGTPTPNSGYGPGPGPAPVNTPEGNGPQSDPQQPNQPTNSGPQENQVGPQATQKPQPTDQGSRPGPQSTKSGPGGPSGKH